MSDEHDPSELVSVIVPVKNGESFIKETLVSVHDQHYRPIEVVVVDDASTDGTSEIVHSLMDDWNGEGDFLIRLFPNDRVGAPAARNLAFSKTTGAIIQYLDADDLLSVDKIARQVQVLNEFSANLVCSEFCSMFTRDDGASSLGEVSVPRATVDHLDWVKDILEGGGVPVHAYLMRKQFVQAVGAWDESLVLRQDTDFMFRAFFLGQAPAVTKGLAIYRRHDRGAVSANVLKEAGLNSWLAVIKKVEQTAIQIGCLEKLVPNLSFAYFLIARRAFPISRTIAMDAYKESCRLVKNGNPQGGWIYKVLYRVLGFIVLQSCLQFITTVRPSRLPFGSGTK